VSGVSILKRGMDVTGSVVLLLVLLPLLLGISLAIVLDSGFPVLFVQTRVGLNGRRFRVYKFRTMVQDAEKHPLGPRTCADDPRITKVGQCLRRWSLDELPQLINVLKGEMSLVGPRPTLPYQVERYDEVQRRRLLVKPGMTGWAQVNGRNELTWPERIELDVWYVDNWSLVLDLKILAGTVGSVVRREGIYGRQIEDEISKVEGHGDTWTSL